MKDEGNYDYREVNLISISGIDSLYSIEQMDTLRINPEFNFSIEKSDNLTYDWRINYKTVSNELTLNKPIGTNFGIWAASFTVKDNNTGLSQTYDFEVEVMNPYGTGLFVLSRKDDGTAMLSFQRRKPELGKFKSDLFTYINPEYGNLGTEPKQLIYVRNEFFVLCEKGDKKMSVLNSSNLKYKSSVNENTVVGGYDGDFNPAFLERHYGGIGIVSNGKFFNYNNGNSGLLYRPVEGDYKLADYITTNASFSSYYWVGYDKEKCKIVTLSSGANRYSYSVIKHWDFNGISTEGMKFIAGANYGRVDYSSPFRTHLKKIILCKGDDLYFYELITEGERNYMGKITAKIGLKYDMTIPNIGNENSVCVFGERSSYWFVATANKIYKIYANGGSPELLYTIDRGEVSVMQISRDEKTLFVGVKVDKGGNTSGDILVIDALEKDKLIEPVYRDVCKEPISLIIK